MQIQDFYQGIKIIRKAVRPLTIVHTKVSLEKNQGGDINVLENVITGPVRNNINDEYMIGFKNEQDDTIVHVYTDSILEYVYKNVHYRLVK